MHCFKTKLFQAILSLYVQSYSSERLLSSTNILALGFYLLKEKKKESVLEDQFHIVTI